MSGSQDEIPPPPPPLPLQSILCVRNLQPWSSSLKLHIFGLRHHRLDTLDFFKEVFELHRLLHDPFISSNVGLINSSGVKVSTLSQFITNAEKSRGLSISSLNDSLRSSFWAKELSQDLWIDLLLSILSMRIFFSSNSDRYASTMPGVEETASINWFVCLNSEKSVSKVLCRWSNSNKEPKLGRSCSEELGTVVGTGVCYRCVLRGVGGRGRVVSDNRGGSAKVITRTSTSKVDSVFRLNKKSIPVSGLGLSMFKTKPDDTK
ncbi:hypothetical protein Tco_0277228 [Tanacetum coccineum]